MGKSISQSFFWKLMERFGVSGVQFVVQLILARLLDPEHYGVLAIMVIFTSLANVFVQSGFNTALIQNKDVTEEDYSSVLWVSLLIAVIVYGVIFFCAPLIGLFYNMPDIVLPLRILALILFPGALNSVQLAKISREMDFQKVFTSSIAGAVASGVVGILMAYLGAGLWALVGQSITNVVATCIVMRFTVQLKIRFVCNWQRIRVLFSFGGKLLVSSLINTLYDDLYSLIIGKKYSSQDLGYYTRGEQFPGFLIDAANGAVQSVMLPAMAVEQDDRMRVKNMMRNSMTISAYIIFPAMLGLAAVATPLISLLLTDKWLECVPYMQICCFVCAMSPVHSCNLQAINAMGRSDIFLKLEIIKKIYSLCALSVSILCFDVPIAIPATGLVNTLVCWVINGWPNKKLLGYSVPEQVKDMVPSMFISGIMFLVVLLVGNLNLPPLVLLLVQVPVGVVTYIALSAIFKPAPYRMLLEYLKSVLAGRGKNNS